MTLLTEVGTFSKETSDVDGTDQTVTLANSSLTPKVIWLWTAGNTSQNTYQEHQNVSYGFSDGTTDGCVSIVSNDNAAAGQCASMVRNDAIIFLYDNAATPATAAIGNIASVAAGNFVIDWATSSATANQINYLVIGGTDITNVKVVNYDQSNQTSGSWSFTGAGFQPDFVNSVFGAETIAYGTSNTSALFTIAAATGSSNRWFMGGLAENAATTMDTYNYKSNIEFYSNHSATNGARNAEADFSAFTSDGMTLNISDTGTNPSHPMPTLYIKGGLWNVNTGTAPSTATNQTITTTSGRDAEAVMLFTWGDITTDSGITADDHYRIGIGAGDNSLNMACISVHDTDNSADSVITRITHNNAIMKAHTAAATATSSTTLANATLTDMDNDGNFVITYSTTLNTMGFHWFAVSKTFSASNNVTRTVPTETITVGGGTLGIARSKIRTRSETVSVSG